jgi:phenylacetate-CoA ligase
VIETVHTGWLLGQLRRGIRQSDGALRVQQDRLLRRAVAHAYAHVPFYRRAWDAAGVDPRDVRSLADLDRLPIIAAADVRDAGATGELMARPIAAGRAFSTNGTSGQPLRVPRGSIETRLWRAAGLRMLFAHGFRWEDTTVQFDAAPAPPHVLQRLGIGRTIWISPALPLDEQLAQLAAAEPDFVFSAPTLLRRVCRAAIRRELGLRAPRAVFCHSEMLDLETRDTVRRALRVDPYDVYGMTEVGYIAWQCERRGDLHVNAELVAVELRTGRGAAGPGELGRVIVTDLRGRTMPLLRCDTGDLARASTSVCRCGMTLPTIGRIEGRQQHAFELVDGRVVTARAVVDHLAGMLPMDEYRLHQETARRFVLTTTGGIRAPSDETLLRDSLGELLGRIELEIRVAPLSQAGGKTHAVTRNGNRGADSIAARFTEPDHAAEQS